MDLPGRSGEEPGSSARVSYAEGELSGAWPLLRRRQEAKTGGAGCSSFRYPLSSSLCPLSLFMGRRGAGTRSSLLGIAGFPVPGVLPREPLLRRTALPGRVGVRDDGAFQLRLAGEEPLVVEREMLRGIPEVREEFSHVSRKAHWIPG